MAHSDLKVGIIGTGRIGRVHAEHLTRRIRGACVTSVADVDAAAARQVAEELDITKVHREYHPVVEDPELDAVVVCTSTDTHAEIIKAAAAAGKHIFCEKPVDVHLASIAEVLEAVEQAGVKFQVGFNRRFDPNFLQLKQAVTEGRIGRPHILKITSRDPAPPSIGYVKRSGGLFVDMTIHDFDMARYLCGSEVVEVFAAGEVLVDEEIGTAGDIDTAVVTLRFENGAIGVIDNSRQAVYGYDQRVEVFGSEGMVAADNRRENDHVLADRTGMHSAPPLHFFMERYVDSFITEMQAFVDAVRNDTEPPVTGHDGFVPVVIALAATKSLAEKRPVRIDEIISPDTALLPHAGDGVRDR